MSRIARRHVNDGYRMVWCRTKREGAVFCSAGLEMSGICMCRKEGHGTCLHSFEKLPILSGVFVLFCVQKKIVPFQVAETHFRKGFLLL